MTWDERYRKGDHVDLPPMGFLRELAERIEPGARVLDLACGAGRHSVLFASKGCRVLAVDSSEVALDLVRSSGMQIVTFASATEEFWIGPDVFDLIIVTMYLDRGLFPKIREAVKVCGRVAMAIPLVDEREGVKPMSPEYLLNPGDLAAEFPEPQWSHEHSIVTLPDPPSRRIEELVVKRNY
jgi:SAM-dependent methyltransferase